MADLSLVARVLEQYPSLIYYITHPEIGPLLIQAVDPNGGFSPQAFEAKLHETNWWKTTAEPARQLELQIQTDPATAQASIDEYIAELRAMAGELGFDFDPVQLQYIAAFGMRSGYSANSTIMRNRLIHDLSGQNAALNLQGFGQIGALRQQVQAIAEGEFFEQWDDMNALAIAQRIATGEDSLESVQARFRERAKQRFPWLAEQLDDGQSLAQIVNPIRSVVAQELELGDTSSVDMTGGKWSSLMQIRNDDGTYRIATESEAREAARRDSRWWDTSGGRQADAGMTRTLLQAFGKVA